MTRAKPLPSAEEVRRALDYDPETGKFTWRWRDDIARRWNRRWAGKPAGNLNRAGRVQLTINFSNYLGHRLAWMHFYGEAPCEIDHINGDSGDNRIANLRLATKSQNMANMKRRGDKVLPKGVSRDKKKFVARICVGNRKLCLGYFDTPLEAYYSYAMAARSKFGRFARL